MTATIRTTTDEAGAERTLRPVGGDELTQLRERLLTREEPETADATLARLLRLAAAEAETLAWRTPFPLLLLPVLLEEKLDAARRYAGGLAAVRGGHRLGSAGGVR